MAKKSMKLGGGGRFKSLVTKIEGQGKSEESAKAIAAASGRKSLGKDKFQKIAASGKRRASK